MRRNFMKERQNTKASEELTHILYAALLRKCEDGLNSSFGRKEAVKR
jgi:hypothetical protein